MAQIFHPSTNTIARVSIFGAVFFVAALLCVTYVVIASPYSTQVHVVREQPVPFSHEHHVRGLGLDCRYCHTSVESSSFAGLPP
ncbi:MAG TPA: cytochrome c3 family protein, partial [Isosphaeraceae bacterium]|nr:cytochrome c3 family protein [Isosphaeraceae bacterium]